MKGILLSVTLFMSQVCAFECNDDLLWQLKQSNREDVVIHLNFKKILAPGEIFRDYWNSKIKVINRMRYPVYFYEVYLDSPRMLTDGAKSYLLSPNNCKILR